MLCGDNPPAPRSRCHKQKPTSEPKLLCNLFKLKLFNCCSDYAILRSNCLSVALFTHCTFVYDLLDLVHNFFYFSSLLFRSSVVSVICDSARIWFCFNNCRLMHFSVADYSLFAIKIHAKHLLVWRYTNKLFTDLLLRRIEATLITSLPNLLLICASECLTMSPLLAFLFFCLTLMTIFTVTTSSQN